MNLQNFLVSAVARVESALLPWFAALPLCRKFRDFQIVESRNMLYVISTENQHALIILLLMRNV